MPLTTGSTGWSAPGTPRGGWSVRRHLVAIAVVVAVAFAIGGTFLGREMWANSESGVRASVEHASGLASDSVAGNIQAARAQVEGVAGNPVAVALLADPSGCEIGFGLEMFPQGRLDLVRADGQVVCSSVPAAEGSSHAEAPWLDAAPTEAGSFDGGPWEDAFSGEVAVMVGMPVVDGAGQRVGAVAAIAPTADVAGRLAELFHGPRGLDFALVDDASGTVLSTSGDLSTTTTPRIPQGEFFVDSQEIPGTTWVVQAGVRRNVAMAAAREVVRDGVVVGIVVLVILLAALVLLNRRIGRPLRQLTDLVGDTGPQVPHALAAIRGPKEVNRLAEEFQFAIAAHEEYEAQLSHLALHDPLTGLPNRALLAERLQHSLERANAGGHTVGVLFIDLDRFKFVNDSLGHTVGDSVLIETASRLRDALRAGDTLARFGGDEFVIVCDECDRASVRELAARVLTAIEAPIQAGTTIVRVTASAGIALSGRDRMDLDLLREADTAMYLAKEQGSGRYEMFDEHLHRKATARLTLETEFRVALERQQLAVVYQPKLDLATGETIGVEALLRWTHPALGPVPPTTFIPIAEETGLILEVGLFVLREACQQAVAWREDGIDLTMAVNLSGRQLADPDLGNQIAEILEQTGMEASRLCLELTESLVMSDTIRTTETLHTLHDLGVKLSIDDFGTGYSSLAYLHRFPIDELKIDRAFVSGVIDSDDQEILVGAMVAMGRALQLTVVAEGVETPAQANRLRELGCDTAQGFLFSKPQPPHDLRPLLTSSKLTIMST